MVTSADPNPNPYQAPLAPLAVSDAALGAFVPGGRRRPGGAGLTWIAQGWGQFTSAPMVWIGVTVVFFVLMFVCAFIPVVSLCTWILQNVLVGGIFMGCRAIDRGEPFAFSFLFAGFSARFGRLAGVGALLLVLNVVFGIVVAVSLLGMLGASAFGGLANIASPWELLSGALGLVVALAVIGVVYLSVVGMLGLFAPVLATVYDQPAVEALKGSFVGCWRNLLSLTVFGLALFVLGVVALIPLGLGLLIFIPLSWAAIYCAARDIFEL